MGHGPTPPVVIVMNARFVPRTRDGPYLYGVVQHAIRVADVLTGAGICVGFVLYERVAGLAMPSRRTTTILRTYPAVVVRFDFAMTEDSVQDAFEQAVSVLERRPAWRADGRPALLYFQTSAVLPFAPPGRAVTVTHHAPFVAQVTDVLGAATASEAFDWDHPKFGHLARSQAAGLDYLAAHPDALCLEISAIQERFLQAAGIRARRIRRLPQPLEGFGEPESTSPDEDQPIWSDLPAHGLIAMTAVARFDAFKHVELFVDGCVEALAEGSIRHALIVGGPPADRRRDDLAERIPPEFRSSFVIVPRLSRSALVGRVFRRLAGRGVFVCTSRFDLVPYTALESSSAGLCTLVPDSETVGAIEYLPPAYRFTPTPAGLAHALAELTESPGKLAAFAATAEAVRRVTSDGTFQAAFVAAINDREP